MRPLLALQTHHAADVNFHALRPFGHIDLHSRTDRTTNAHNVDQNVKATVCVDSSAHSPLAVILFGDISRYGDSLAKAILVDEVDGALCQVELEVYTYNATSCLGQ